MYHPYLPSLYMPPSYSFPTAAALSDLLNWNEGRFCISVSYLSFFLSLRLGSDDRDGVQKIVVGPTRSAAEYRDVNKGLYVVAR